MERTITLIVNGRRETVTCTARDTLLDVLRRELKLFGAREGCGIGICGACTVLIDGQAISSCLALAALAEGKTITTVEGLAGEEGQLDPVQAAFVEQSAFQCSYCTPGMILSVHALLSENPDPDDHAIREYLAGNLCRCGSYLNILEAVRAAVARLRATSVVSVEPRS